MYSCRKNNNKLQLNLKHKWCTDVQRQEQEEETAKLSKLDNFSQLLLASIDSTEASMVVHKLRCESECGFPLF